MRIDWDRTEVRVETAGRYHWKSGVDRERTWNGRLYQYVLWYTLGGRADIQLHSGRVPVTRGTLLWLRPGWQYDCVQDPADPIRKYAIHFHLLNADGSPRPSTKPLPPELLRVDVDEALVCGILERLVGPVPFNQGQFEFKAPARWAAVVMLRGLLMHLDAMNTPGEDFSLRDATSTLDPTSEIGRIASEIATSPGEVPSIAELAVRCKMQPSHFCQVFKKHFRRTPRDFLILWRLRHARRLLTDTDLSVKQIAFSLGYENPHFFSRQFKAEVGRTPTAYRAAQRRASSIPI